MTGTEEARAELRDIIAGWPVGSGYYQTSIAVDEATEIADAILKWQASRAASETSGADHEHEFFDQCACGQDAGSYYKRGAAGRLLCRVRRHRLDYSIRYVWGRHELGCTRCDYKEVAHG